MDIKECIKFSNETIISYVATVDGDQPGVRALHSQEHFWTKEKNLTPKEIIQF